MKKGVISLALASALVSCATTKTGTAKTIDIVGSGVMHRPVIADLNIQQEKVSKTVTISNIESLEAAKNQAVRELIKENKADLLVEPTYESSTQNSKTELTVYGWPANYKNFRQVEEKDIKFLEIKPSYLQKAETAQPAVQKKKGNGLLWGLLGAVGLAGIIVAASGV